MKLKTIIDNVNVFHSEKPEDYCESIDIMSDTVLGVRGNKCSEMIWFLEYDPLYTAGSSASKEDIYGINDFPVYKSGRGGKYTYHGPGQRVIYLMLNLKRNCDSPDIRRYIRVLEKWVIDAAYVFGIDCFTVDGHPGVWHEKGKIASIGIRISRWVTSYGVAINVDTDLSHFEGIRPCGIDGKQLTSLSRVSNYKISMCDLDKALIEKIPSVLTSV